MSAALLALLAAEGLAVTEAAVDHALDHHGRPCVDVWWRVSPSLHTDRGVRCGAVGSGPDEGSARRACAADLRALLRGHLASVAADLTDSRTDERFDVVIANQCLHHILELERVFERISAIMAPDGVFLTSDMIGRNGHMRWPEARELIDRFWEELPKAYRYHRLLRRQENRFQDWDCSITGFEGIRAQDILPLLVQRFDFEFFYAFGNVIDPFVDRGFGPNFDADAEWDRDFIDRVHAADEAAFDAGTIKPTHMIAAMRHRQGLVPRVWKSRTPESCVRVPT